MSILRTQIAEWRIYSLASRPQSLSWRTKSIRILSGSRTQHTTPTITAEPLTKVVDSKKMQRQNQPIYSAELDQASSQFSPIPKRPTNVNEKGDIIPAAVVSGAPFELQARTVRIYLPAKPATQSGNWHSHDWRMDWDILSKGHRWENPLMGWQSSADFMQGTHLTFKTKEQAIKFAEAQGYDYVVHEPNIRKTETKAYANNFLWSEKKLKHIRTK